MERCKLCRKKTLTPVTCTCGNIYCLKHRYQEIHNCTNLEKDIQKEKEILKEQMKSSKPKKVDKL